MNIKQNQVVTPLEMSCKAQLLHLLKEVITYSGRGMFHRGHYQECIESDQMKYSLVELGVNGGDAQAFVGLCLPKQCRDSIITNSINSALKILGTPFSVYSLNSEPNRYSYPMDWLSYFTLILLVAICALVFFATLRGYKSNKNRQNKFLRCFDLDKNVREHFKVRQNEDLNVWDGVRSLAMMWVVIGHSLSFWMTHVENIASIMIFGNKPFFLIIGAGILSVDTFLALGGFFLAFIMLRNKISSKLCGISILQRALRIWPAYVLSMMFFSSLYMKMSSGPFWQQMQDQTDLCVKMWRQFLFIANFVENGAGGCLSWGWYLQVDFQLFIVGILLLLGYTHRKSLFYTAMGLLMIGSMVFQFVYIQTSGITIFTDLSSQTDFRNFMHDVYIKPYGRCVPYLMGLLLGAYFMKFRENNQDRSKQQETGLQRLKVYYTEHELVRIISQWAGILIMAFVTFIPRTIQVGLKWPQLLHTLYWVFSKPIFIFGLIITILPSLLGVRQSLFRLILCSKLLSFIAKISFCTYLVHLMVVYGFIYDRSYDIYYSLLDSFVIYLGLLVICLALGFVLTVTVQVPFSNLLKMLRRRIDKGQEATTEREISETLLINSTEDNIFGEIKVNSSKLSIN